MVSKEDLKLYANKLMFDMNEEEYDVLLKEFSIILKKLEFINEIEGISDYEPMTFPFSVTPKLREDEMCDTLLTEEVISNAPKSEFNMVVLPKVVDHE